MQPKRNHVLLFAKGIAMGAADVVPGVSGGTIAFISGIYDELVDSVKGLNPAALKYLVRRGPRQFWQQINGTFLTVLLAGILTSLFSLARLVRFGLEAYPLLIWAFFFGLIVASIIYVSRQQQHWRPREWLGLVAGTLMALFCAFSPPLAIEASPVTVFFAGMLAICAMILPGISGSFILLLIGMYPALIDALTTFNLGFLAVFGAGAALGLMLFSQLLSWLLHHHRSTTLAVLIGFLVGSLAVVWPWKQELTPDGAGFAFGTRQLMTPGIYDDAVGSARTMECLVLMMVGLVLVLGLEYLGKYGFRRRRLD